MEGCIKGDIFQNSGRGFLERKTNVLVYIVLKNTLQLSGNHVGPFLIFYFNHTIFLLVSLRQCIIFKDIGNKIALSLFSSNF